MSHGRQLISSGGGRSRGCSGRTCAKQERAECSDSAAERWSLCNYPHWFAEPGHDGMQPAHCNMISRVPALLLTDPDQRVALPQHVQCQGMQSTSASMHMGLHVWLRKQVQASDVSTGVL